MIPLFLGPILFDETSLEPPESLAISSSVSMAVIDYPGGLRTIQTFGIFPDPIKFRGKISRPDALDRIQMMKAAVAAQQAMPFVYGGLSWTGYVRRFTPVVLHRWRGEYEIEFVPQTDNTLGAQDGGDPSAEQQLGDQTSGLQDTTGATQSGTFAAAGSPLAQQLDANPEAFSSGGYSFGPAYTADADGIPTAADGSDLASPIPGGVGAPGLAPGAFVSGGMTFGPTYVGAPDGTPLPTQIASPAGVLLGAVNIGLQNAGGVVANIATADALAITAASQTLIQTTGAIVASPIVSAPLAYAAAMMQANATVIGSIVGGTGKTQWTRQMVNPNLIQLAAQYYGDASKWQLIAAANGLTDPQPLGQFQITIPAA